jgi:hypothetical protein
MEAWMVYEAMTVPAARLPMSAGALSSQSRVFAPYERSRQLQAG